jgi:very-short-patch-repair endonuclease
LPDLSGDQLTALRVGGVLSCASAAVVLGLDLLDDPGPPHVTVPRRTAVRQEPPTVFHRRDVPTEASTTTLPRTAADCSRCLPPTPALVVVESALRKGASISEIEACLWGRGSGAARALVRRADPRSGSSGETVARIAIEDAGFNVQSQVHVPGVGWVDIIVEGRVVVEIDGLAYHGDARQFAADRRRDAALVAMGYLVLRFTWVDAVRRPEYVVAMVRQAVARAS